MYEKQLFIHSYSTCDDLYRNKSCSILFPLEKNMFLNEPRRKLKFSASYTNVNEDIVKQTLHRGESPAFK